MAVCSHTHPHLHTLGQCRHISELTCTSLGSERKPAILEKTHADMKSKCKLHTDGGPTQCELISFLINIIMKQHWMKQHYSRIWSYVFFPFLCFPLMYLTTGRKKQVVSFKNKPKSAGCFGIIHIFVISPVCVKYLLT